jgi:CheY-like chemotaxis protein
MRILLVEDDPMNVELFSAVLEGDGHDILVETDGLRGQERALREQLDLVILDIHLPHRDGEMICRELRERGVEIPILALSAAALPEQIEQAMRAGFNEYLTKPIAPTALRRAVRQYEEGYAPAD